MSSNENDQENRQSSFKVSDRRMFTPDGELIDRQAESAEREETETAQEKAQKQDSRESSFQGPRSAGRGTEGESERKKSIDFSSFILSLATSAMAYLGEVPDPTSGQSVENVEAAQQMIDILTILQEKTAGNLEADEARLLDDILYELRMKYLTRAKVIQL